MEKNEVILSLSLCLTLSQIRTKWWKRLSELTNQFTKKCAIMKSWCRYRAEKTQIKCLMQKLKHFKVSKS